MSNKASCTALTMTTIVLSFDEIIQSHLLTEYALTEQMDDLAKSKEPDVTMLCQGSPKTAGRFFIFVFYVLSYRLN